MEELAEKILKYQADIDWYGLCDDYGNIETDEEARKVAFEEILNTLQNSPEDIIKSLQETIEDLECDEDYNNNEIYIKTKELIHEIENL